MQYIGFFFNHENAVSMYKYNVVDRYIIFNFTQALVIITYFYLIKNSLVKLNDKKWIFVVTRKLLWYCSLKLNMYDLWCQWKIV